MKTILIFTLLLLFNFGFCSNLLPEIAPYHIVSDVYNSKIPKGKCVIFGKIYDAKTSELIKNATIISGLKKFTTDANGNFKFYQKTDVKYIIFSKINYSNSFIEDYVFKSKHKINVNVYLKNSKEEQQFELKKPVVYCYSDQDLDFKFQLKPMGDLKFHYPKADLTLEMLNSSGETREVYNWDMKLKNNVLMDKKLVEYPYLFWESKQANLKYKSNLVEAYNNQYLVYVSHYHGSLIAKNDLLNFFDTTLTNLGFNSTEKTDFITFWLPQMTQKESYFIQFLRDEECNQFATYNIEPKPQKVNRIYMLFSGIEKNFNPVTIPQKLHKIERNGFYLVDWGGMEVPMKESLNGKELNEFKITHNE